MTFGVFYKNKSSFTPTQQLNKQTTNTQTPNLVLTPTDSIQQRTTISDFKRVKSSYKRISLSELIEDSIMFSGMVPFYISFLYTFAKIHVLITIK